MNKKHVTKNEPKNGPKSAVYAATAVADPAPPGAVSRLSATRALARPLAFILALLTMTALPVISRNPALLWSFRAASLALLAWTGVLFATSVGSGRTFTLEIILRRQHYLQACLQGLLILYWGYYWRQVYTSWHLILGQLLFAYAFDFLLSWSRRDNYALGFGQFPVIFSITLFFWFKDDWFYLQFLLVAVGFAAKELIRWTKDGRSAHIFNPSSFPLALFSVALLIAGRSDMTWGPLIALTEFYPPHMYLVLFLIGLPGQFLFGVTPMTMSAILTTYFFSALYFAATGSYYFLDSHIPIAVFLGMHLLFTDPSTAPRTELGRIIFGVLYGIANLIAFHFLIVAERPGFYDKLLPVPILNLSILAIDRVARSKYLRMLDPAALGRALAPRQRHLAYMSVWAIAFAAMSATGNVGDKHPGQWLPFWQNACAEGGRNACEVLVYLEQRHCGEGSGWACNELGIHQAARESATPKAAGTFVRGCELGFTAACDNGTRLSLGRNLRHEPPRLEDYPFILTGSKAPITDRDPAALYARACDLGWPDACQSSASGQGAP